MTSILQYALSIKRLSDTITGRKLPRCECGEYAANRGWQPDLCEACYVDWLLTPEKKYG